MTYSLIFVFSLSFFVLLLRWLQLIDFKLFVNILAISSSIDKSPNERFLWFVNMYAVAVCLTMISLPKHISKLKHSSDNTTLWLKKDHNKLFTSIKKITLLDLLYITYILRIHYKLIKWIFDGPKFMFKWIWISIK